MRDEAASAPGRRVQAAVLARGLRASGPVLMALVVVVEVVSGFLPAIAAVLLQRAVDAVVTHGPALRWMVLSLLAGLAVTLLNPLTKLLTGMMDRRCQVWSMEALYRALGALPSLRELEDPQFRDALRVAQGAGSQAPTDVFSGGMGTVRTLITLSSFVVLLGTKEPMSLPLIALAAVPVAVLAWRQAKQRMALFWRTSRLSRRAEVYADMLTDLHAAKELRIFGTAPFFRRLMSADLRGAAREQDRFECRWVAFEALAEGAAAVLNGALCLYLVSRAARGSLSVGELTMLLAAVASVQMSVLGLMETFGQLRTSIGNFETFVRLVTVRPAQVLSVPGPTPSHVPARGLYLDGVSFRYPQADVDAVHDVTMLLRPGTTTAIVGFNGSGKTTLIKLLCRFYEPTCGRIYLDGRDISTLDVDEYRAGITAVFQDYMDYDLSVRQNVTIGDPERATTDDEVWAVLREVGLEERFRGRGAELDTLLSRSFYYGEDIDKNALLSGGQWQRLAIARSRFRGGRALQIYDEPTANLDPMAEWEVSRLLDQRVPGSIAVCVSHRLSTIRHAATIHLMDGGRVVESGTHDELLAAGGPYALMCQKQEEGLLSDAPADHPAAVGS